MKQRMVIGLSAAALLAAAFGLAPAIRGQSSGKPDLIVDQAALRQHWVVRTENLPADFCSVIEGEITPGVHQLVRFTVATPNIGDADLAVGDPNVHIAANDGLFEFATCHNHYHFRHYALYQLIDPATGHVWRAAKRGFCMIDIEKFQDYTGDADNKRHFASCGAVGIPGNQGISKRWSDVYVCLDPVGFCHTLPESDYANNVAQVSITIPDHNGRQSVGPLKNEPMLTTESIDGK